MTPGHAPVRLHFRLPAETPSSERALVGVDIPISEYDTIGLHRDVGQTRPANHGIAFIPSNQSTFLDINAVLDLVVHGPVYSIRIRDRPRQRVGTRGRGPLFC